MTYPTVCAIMLAGDSARRGPLIRSATDCFLAQTYGPKRLLIWTEQAPSIGAMRNAAAEASNCDVLVHWDSDDWSDRKRIEEQVNQLLDCGGDCVGYRRLLFWEETLREAWWYTSEIPDYCVGTSLCYWHDSWRATRFRGVSEGEDLDFQLRLKKRCASLGSIFEPRVIARIHAGNTCSRIDPAGPEWARSPKWDAYCAERMGA